MIIDLAVRRIGQTLNLGKPIEEVMIFVFQDLIREANEEVVFRRPTDPKEIAAIFEEKANEWRLICGRFGSAYKLNEWGFRLMFRKYSPNMYKSFVENGFTPIPPEFDPEFVPDAEKRHKNSH